MPPGSASNGVAGAGSEASLLLLVRQQAEEIRKLRKEVLNVTNERDALLCEVHHLNMDILASELGRIGSCSSTSVGGGDDDDLNLDENGDTDGEHDDDTCNSKKNGNESSRLGSGPVRLGRRYINNNNNEKMRPKLLHTDAFAISDENAQDSLYYGNHFHETRVDDGKTM